MAKSEVVMMVTVLREFAAQQRTLSEDAHAVARDAACVIDAVTSAVFGRQGKDPSAVVDSLRAIYVEHGFG